MEVQEEGLVSPVPEALVCWAPCAQWLRLLRGTCFPAKMIPTSFPLKDPTCLGLGPKD